MRLWFWILAGALLCPVASVGQTVGQSGPEGGVVTLPPVEVIGNSSLLGSGVDREQVPTQTQVLNRDAIVRTGIPQAVQALEDNVPGVSLSAAPETRINPICFTTDLRHRPYRARRRASPSTSTAYASTRRSAIR